MITHNSYWLCAKSLLHAYRQAEQEFTDTSIAPYKQ
jgi:hypothetical protein